MAKRVKYRFRETHQTIKRCAISGEVDALGVRNTEGVLIQRKTSQRHVVLHNHAVNIASTVRIAEGLAR